MVSAFSACDPVIAVMFKTELCQNISLREGGAMGTVCGSALHATHLTLCGKKGIQFEGLVAEVGSKDGPSKWGRVVCRHWLCLRITLKGDTGPPSIKKNT